MALALYRRYRPDTFDGVIGQDHVTKPLSRALDEGKLTHAYLFSGPRGCGKTSSARILARCINCVKGPTSHPCGECASCRDLATNGPGSIDVVEIDAASHGSVDDARELRERAGFAPARDRYKIFILDEAHMVTNNGFNALLKTVEEPPEHVMFIFATTEPEKVLGTIRSRTHHYPFRLVPPEVMQPYLEDICEKESIHPEPGVLKLAMRAGGGSMRDTLSVLDQLMIGAVDGTITYEDSVALLGFTPDTLIREAIDAVIAQDGAALYGVIERVVTGGFDPRKFVEDLLAYVRDLLILSLAGREAQSALSSGQSAQRLEEMNEQAGKLSLAQLNVMAERINTALGSMVGTLSPRMRLELLAAQLLLPAVLPASPEVQTQVSAPAHTSAQGASPRVSLREKARAAAQPQPAAPAQTPAPAQVSAQPAVQPVAQSSAVPSAPAVQLNPAEASIHWNQVIAALPEKIRDVVNAQHIPHVELQKRNERYFMILTFANPLSQHAFSLSVSTEAVDGQTSLQKILNAKLTDHYGQNVVVAPAPRTADGQTVAPLRKLPPDQQAKIKAQVAQMAMKSALAAVQAQTSEPSSDAQASSSETADHADDTEAHRSHDPWAQPASQSQPVEKSPEHEPESTPTPAPESHAADYDPWAKPAQNEQVNSSQPAEVPPQAQDVHIQTEDVPSSLSERPELSEQTVTAEPHEPQAQVAAEEDTYSLDDADLTSGQTMSMDDLARMFNAKKTEEYAADDDRNPARSA
ncbi:DNA polymerase III subunit gamma and tau [Alloscardovia macacae]|uniref:DNA polymerase III subunit gamma/tau n=1 Tax=Alloscardovia macacae TaxID=1160091 RepID=A0A261F405_9BIFI|nr:DNA polymerase III subunit gamma and tau [Alloscardovia macacae]OZG53828.1 DNA polymerase III subunit gamma/tau [Alloscardovia macacae]